VSLKCRQCGSIVAPIILGYYEPYTLCLACGEFVLRDVRTVALLMVKRYGDDAVLEAAKRADQLLDEDDVVGAATWHDIQNAIERLQG
jgi:hypothetical protein